MVENNKMVQFMKMMEKMQARVDESEKKMNWWSVCFIKDTPKEDGEDVKKRKKEGE